MGAVLSRHVFPFGATPEAIMHRGLGAGTEQAVSREKLMVSQARKPWALLGSPCKSDVLV